MKLPRLDDIDLGSLEPDDPMERGPIARRVRDQLHREYVRRTQAEIQRFAHHEAGHVVVSWFGGLTPWRCTLQPWAWEANARTTQSEPLDAFHPVALELGLAGVVAESLHLGRSVRLGSDARDYRRASGALPVRLTPALAAELQVLGPGISVEIEESRAKQVFPKVRRALGRFMAQGDVWEAVTAVAESLARRTTLDAKRLRSPQARHAPPPVMWSYWSETADAILSREARRLCRRTGQHR